MVACVAGGLRRVLCQNPIWRPDIRGPPATRATNMADTCFEKFTRCAKLCGLFSWLYFSDADWLSRQTSITWLSVYWLFCSFDVLCVCYSLSSHTFLSLLQFMYMLGSSIEKYCGLDCWNDLYHYPFPFLCFPFPPVFLFHFFVFVYKHKDLFS